MQVYLTVPDQKNQIDFAILDPVKNTLAYMSNKEQYFGFYNFMDFEITDKYPNLYKTQQMAWNFLDSSIY